MSRPKPKLAKELNEKSVGGDKNCIGASSPNGTKKLALGMQSGCTRRKDCRTEYMYVCIAKTSKDPLALSEEIIS